MAKNILLMLTCMLVSDWANVLLKLGVEQTSVGLSWEKILAMISNPWLLSGVALYGGGMFLWLTVLEKNEFGFVMAFFSLHYVHLMLLAKYVFHEPIKWNMWLGTFMIVLGVGMFNITQLMGNDP